jgi:hypothetical protein
MSAQHPTALCPVCVAQVETVDGLLINHRHRDQLGPCPAGQINPPTTTDQEATR